MSIIRTVFYPLIVGTCRTRFLLMGATSDGYRESEKSWTELLLDVKNRGLSVDPKLVTGDGTLGFWSALKKVFPATPPQRCRVRKTANVLNKMPTSLHPKAKAMLHQIWMAETKKEAEKAFDLFLKTFRAKYSKATDCLQDDREVLLTFYDFPAEHWVHIRTTNPIESTFATVRLRTNKTKGCGSRTACLTMVFKLAQCAENHWRILNGSPLLDEVIRGIKFVRVMGSDLYGSWGQTYIKLLSITPSSHCKEFSVKIPLSETNKPIWRRADNDHPPRALPGVKADFIRLDTTRKVPA